MAIAWDDFWELAVRAKLLTRKDIQRQVHGYQAARPGAGTNVQDLAGWLVARGRLTDYQAQVLLAGQPGPFLFDAYQLQSPLGQLPEPRYFIGKHLPTSHPVLMQPLPDPVWTDGQPNAATKNSVQIWHDLRHPYLCRVHELVYSPVSQLLISAAPDGRSLHDFLSGRTGGVPFSQAGRWANQIALALAALHKRGQVHGQVGVEAIWLLGNGDAMLLPSDMAGSSNGEIARDVQAYAYLLHRLLVGLPRTGVTGSMNPRMGRAVTPQRTIEEVRQRAPAVIADAMARILQPLPASRLDDLNVIIRRVQSVLPSAAASVEPPPTPATAEAYEAWRKTCASPIRAATSSDEDSILETTFQPIRVEPASLAARSRLAKRRPWPWLLITIPILVVVVAALLPWGARPATHPSTTPRETPAEGGPPVSAPTPGHHQDEKSNPFHSGSPVRPATSSDRELLWISPTAGPMASPQSLPSLQYLPDATRAILLVRPAQLLITDEGQRLLRAMGPDFHGLQEQWEASARVRLADVEQLTLALAPSDDIVPRCVIVVQLREAPALANPWGEVIETRGNATMYQANPWWRLVPSNRNGKVFVMATRDALNTILERDGAPPPLARSLNQLLRMVDINRHATLIFEPAFLMSDTSGLWSEPWHAWLSHLKSFFAQDILAAALSLHVEHSCYLEARFAGAANAVPETLVQRARGELGTWPMHANTWLSSTSITGHWKPLADRYPRMLQFLSDHARGGVEQSFPIVNVTMPTYAAHNLLLATELMMNDAGEVAADTKTATDSETTSEGPAATVDAREDGDSRPPTP